MHISAAALPATGDKPLTLLVPEANAPHPDADAICPRCRGPMGAYRYATVRLANGHTEQKRPSWRCIRCKLEIVSVSGTGKERASVTTWDEKSEPVSGEQPKTIAYPENQ